MGIDRCGSSALAFENVEAVVAGASKTRLVVFRIRFGVSSSVSVLSVVETSARSVFNCGASAVTSTVCDAVPGLQLEIYLRGTIGKDRDDIRLKRGETRRLNLELIVIWNQVVDQILARACACDNPGCALICVSHGDGSARHSRATGVGNHTIDRAKDSLRQRAAREPTPEGHSVTATVRTMRLPSSASLAVIDETET